MPFGVDLPDNIGSGAPSPEPSTGGTPSDTTVSSEKASDTGLADGKPSITDLDKLERFRFEGREWSRKELQNAYLRQQDYSRKTQELAETRKYTDNFAADLRTVMKDRGRFQEFQRLYPREFVERAQEILETMPKAGGQATTEVQDPVNEKLAALEGKIQSYEQRAEAQEIEKLQLWIDNQFANLSKKYPDANPELVNARAEVQARRGVKITEPVLEKLFKENDGQIKAQFEARYKGKVSKQINAGREGRDVGPGGGLPGDAPKNPKTFKEARDMMISDMQAQQRR